MNKKAYEAPTVRKVRLVVKNSILVACHSSPNMDPQDTLGCAVTFACYDPPT